nr:hypothetical protein [Tanacetum cinerariifolium]
RQRWLGRRLFYGAHAGGGIFFLHWPHCGQHFGLGRAGRANYARRRYARLFDGVCTAVHAVCHLPSLAQKPAPLGRLAQYRESSAGLCGADAGPQVLEHGRLGLPLGHPDPRCVFGALDSVIGTAGLVPVG